MPKAEIYDITLKPLSKKDKQSDNGFFHPEETIEINFGRDSWFEVDATGLVKTLSIKGENVISDVTLADLAKAYLKQEKRAAKPNKVRTKATATTF
jgi:hypothetical protein